MKKIKGLLYCCKAKPYLWKYWFSGDNGNGYNYEISLSPKEREDEGTILNGTIPCECEIEIEEIVCDGYALHISNLKIFDKPRELYDCLIHPKIEPRYYGCEHLSKAPQNMMYVELDDVKYILISIQPKELCRILNGEQTILIKKQVLNCMKGNE